MQCDADVMLQQTASPYGAWDLSLKFHEKDRRWGSILLKKYCEAYLHNQKQFEPPHEIMALFVLCKFILQTHMHSHPVGLDV